MKKEGILNKKEKEKDGEQKKVPKNKKRPKARRKRNETKFRLYAFQHKSLTLQDPKPIKLSINRIPCSIFLRNLNNDEAIQRTEGGMFITIDFVLKNESDLIRATNQGLSLIEDFLSGVSLVEGAVFGDVEPVQIIRYEKSRKQKYSMIHFLDLSLKHFYKAISSSTLQEIKSILAHWDGLDSGKRLRRAARQFHKAKNTRDTLTAFQHAYIGLEAMERPLADAQNIPPGVEEIKGKCHRCGQEYIRKRSVLAGVRSYICGNMHQEASTPVRRKEWKRINGLRHDVFHNLKDDDELMKEAEIALPAAMHFLHDSICCMSHSHSLEANKFGLFRGVTRHVFIGVFSSPKLGPIDRWVPLFDSKIGSWRRHSKFEWVPEFIYANKGIKDLQISACYLKGQIYTARESDLKPLGVEHKY